MILFHTAGKPAGQVEKRKRRREKEALKTGKMKKKIQEETEVD